MTKTQINRLRLLYAVIAGIPDDRIALRFWRGSPSKPGSSNKLNDHQLVHDCGTNACAVGWATAHPDFQAQGFTMTYLARNDGEMTPTFKGHTGFNAIEAFFGVDRQVAHDLFCFGLRNLDGVSFHRLTERQQVLGRIRRFLLGRNVITPARCMELARQEEVLV